MIIAGIDIGSRNTKLVLWDTSTTRIIFSCYNSTDVSPLRSLQSLYNKAYLALNIKSQDIDVRVATGYGRNLVTDPDRIYSEISCHAVGVRYYHPECRTVIDIGGQDSKIIVMDESGKVMDFAMNDKCAAGTGRFLEMTGMRLGCGLEGLSDLADKATRDLELNSTCVVFAETEIISMMSQGISAADISLSVHRSIARRVHSQSGSLDIVKPVSFTGGVAQNPALARCLSETFGMPLLVLPEPEITGALGAALLAST